LTLTRRRFHLARLLHAFRAAGAIGRAMALGLALVLTVGGCTQLEQEERALTFRVVPGAPSWYAGLPDGVVESDIPVSAKGKAQNVHAWWWPAEKRGAPAVLYLHGSRWNLTGQVFRIEQLHEFGFSVLAIDYRGFGKSDGELPSEKTVYEDAHAAWSRLTQLQPDAGKRFIYGHSLGGAVAIDLAVSLQNPPQAPRHTLAGFASSTLHGQKHSPQPGQHTAATDAINTQAGARGLIVESSFTTLADVAKSLTYPWLPVQLLLSQKFDSLGKIAHVAMPVLIVHGTDDRYIPSRFSQKLFDAVESRKRLLLVPGGTHNNSLELGEVAWRQAFRDLFGLTLQPA
jgi:pimeloyl-ACP methyl ester carboxylesterase